MQQIIPETQHALADLAAHVLLKSFFIVTNHLTHIPKG